MAPWLFAAAYETGERLQHVWADMAYRGQRLRAWVEDECGWTLEIVARPRRWGWYPIDVEPPPVPAFTVLPRRWVVERTIAWVGRYRRLSKTFGVRYPVETSAEGILRLFPLSLWERAG
jgi:putative transposase